MAWLATLLFLPLLHTTGRAQSSLRGIAMSDAGLPGQEHHGPVHG